ncbi:hypothetical protein CERZMDRAFT_85833 [Cercospora zeae-maydis SCOH1-5]|uniref:Uncharacterized protein n=1 Tax=Cercospora zeae-maydis SCOH1-5 TaxID=717836 RepID=A0A6A6FBY1_9PEZI|nr:hypothetical protein CERZMDRAFT_85833 [Cercospora zeae-maydis SCOH1-5]
MMNVGCLIQRQCIFVIDASQITTTPPCQRCADYSDHYSARVRSQQVRLIILQATGRDAVNNGSQQSRCKTPVAGPGIVREVACRPARYKPYSWPRRHGEFQPQPAAPHLIISGRAFSGAGAGRLQSARPPTPRSPATYTTVHNMIPADSLKPIRDDDDG